MSSKFCLKNALLNFVNTYFDLKSRNMAIILKDFNHVTVVEGELVPSSNRFDLEDLLGNFDYKRIIKMQFDRLDSNYQELLTVS